MVDVRNRSDIDLLLRGFYGQVFADAFLGRVFVDVAHMDLEAHLPEIGNFWEKVLFNTSEYDGQAMQVHRRLDQLEPLTPAHFTRWLELWDQTLTALYDGPVAEQARAHAARIAVAFQRNLHVVGDQTRPEIPLSPARPT